MLTGAMVAKTNRRRKADRARADAKRALAQRRRDRAETSRLSQRRLELLRDPATPPDELAELLAEHYEGGPVEAGLVPSLLDGGADADALVQASRLLWNGAAGDGDADEDATWSGSLADGGTDGSDGSHGNGPGGDRASLTAMTFAAAVARAAGDEAAERELIARLSAAIQPPAGDAEAAGDGAGRDDDTRLGVTRFILDLGYATRAAGLLEPVLRARPHDEEAAEQYGTAIERAYESLGSAGRDKADEATLAVLARFADRSGLMALYDALGKYLAETAHGDHLQETVAAHRKAVLDMGWPENEAQGFGEFAEELALSGTAAGADPDVNPMAAFASDPATPPELAARATAWYEHIRYGLWKVEDPVPAPGVWCTEIVSAARRYVQFPAERVGRLPRWAVWLGGLLPVEGIWRITGRGIWLSPREADAAAEFVDRAGDELARVVTGTRARDLADSGPEDIPFASAGPRGIQAGYDSAFEPDTAALSSRVINALATRIAVGVYAWRRSRARAEHLAVAGFDQRLPALRGRTIRQAVRGSPEDQMRVEALLREWEYLSDLLTAAGKPGIDTAVLRRELGLPSDLDDS